MIVNDRKYKCYYLDIIWILFGVSVMFCLKLHGGVISQIKQAGLSVAGGITPI